MVWDSGKRVRVSGFSKVFIGFRRGFCRALAGLLQDFMGRSARPVQGGSRLIRAELKGFTWVVVKTMVPFWVPSIIRHLLFRVPKRDLNFDNHPHVETARARF